ncbi:hypothetical protein AAHA92_00258 [Salvia divinorum]|uniref:CASP-like protein n=1 Tax=Salvia divinorum TaxID=28513 RepID=A0ABD1IM49_SALDI
MSKNEDVEEAENGLKCGKFSAAVVTARGVAMASLMASLAVLLTNDATFNRSYVYTYKRVFSYKKKRLINSYSLLKFCFYVDKMATVLLATGGGAAFCATVDLKRVEWNEYNSKKQDFLSMGYVAAAFRHPLFFHSLFTRPH